MTRKSQQCMLSCCYTKAARMGRKTLPWQMNLISLCQSRVDDWSGPVGLRTRLWTDHLGLWGFSDLGSFESSRSWSLCWSDTTFQLQIEAGCSQLQLPWDMVSVTSGCIFMAELGSGCLGVPDAAWSLEASLKRGWGMSGISSSKSTEWLGPATSLL